MATGDGADNEALKKRVRKLADTISPSFDPKGHVLNKLFADEVITMEDKVKIENIPRKQDRANALFEFLYTVQHRTAFILFRKALTKEYDWIVKIIDEEESLTTTESNTPDTQQEAPAVSQGNLRPGNQDNSMELDENDLR